MEKILKAIEQGYFYHSDRKITIPENYSITKAKTGFFLNLKLLDFDCQYSDDGITLTKPIPEEPKPAVNQLYHNSDIGAFDLSSGKQGFGCKYYYIKDPSGFIVPAIVGTNVLSWDQIHK